jgi:hypothetical protein
MRLIPPSAQTVEDDDAPKQTPKRPINETEEGTEALERLETVGEEFATILSNACATVSNASTRIPTVMLTSMLYGFSRDIEAMLTAMELGEATDGHKGRSAEASASRGTSRGSAARQIASGKTGSGRPKSDSKSDAKVDSGTASKKPAGTGRGRGRPKGSKNKAKGGTAKGSAAKHTGKSSAGRKSQAAKPKAKKRRWPIAATERSVQWSAFDHESQTQGVICHTRKLWRWREAIMNYRLGTSSRHSERSMRRLIQTRTVHRKQPARVDWKSFWHWTGTAWFWVKTVPAHWSVKNIALHISLTRFLADATN